MSSLFWWILFMIDNFFLDYGNWWSMKVRHQQFCFSFFVNKIVFSVFLPSSCLGDLLFVVVVVHKRIFHLVWCIGISLWSGLFESPFFKKIINQSDVRVIYQSERGGPENWHLCPVAWRKKKPWPYFPTKSTSLPERRILKYCI